jgi:hypothetical protein
MALGLAVLVSVLSASMALVTLLLRRASIVVLAGGVDCGSSISKVPAQWEIIGCATVVGNVIRPNKFPANVQEFFI